MTASAGPERKGYELPSVRENLRVDLKKPMTNLERHVKSMPYDITAFPLRVTADN
jgi:hypothetical protein